MVMLISQEKTWKLIGLGSHSFLPDDPVILREMGIKLS